MKREQAFIKAFILTIFFLSLASTIFQNEIFENIVYALVFPTFFMSLIEFIIDIRNIADEEARNLQKGYEELAGLQQENAELKIENNRLLGKSDKDSIIEVEEVYNKATENIKIATDYMKVIATLIKLEKILSKIYVIVLVLFFSSIIFSSIIVNYLKAINLNCITLWSLLLALLNTYYKKEYSAKLVTRLKEYYENKRLKQSLETTKNNKE